MRSSFSIKTPAGQRSGVPFALLETMVIIGLLLTGFLFKGVTPLHMGDNAWMYRGEWYALFGVAALFGILFLVIMARHIKIGFSPFWFITVVTLALGNTIGLFALPLVQTGTGITYQGDLFPYQFATNMGQRMQWCLSFLLTCFYIYLLFAVFPKAFAGTRKLAKAYGCLVILGYVSVIFSLIKDHDIYAEYFDPAAWIHPNGITSFTENPNTFAFLLLVASVAACLLQMRHRNSLNYFALALFTVIQGFVGSRSGILAQLVLIVGLAVVRFGANLKSHPGKAWGLFLTFIGVTVTSIILLFANPFPVGSFLYRICKKLAGDFSFSGVVDPSGRMIVFNHVISILNEDPIRWLFGVGDRQSIFYFGARTFPKFYITQEAGYAHSAILQDLLSGGFLRLALGVALIVRGAYKGFYLWGKRDAKGPFFLFLLLLFALHGLVETTCFANFDSRGMLLYGLVLLPLDIHYHFHESKELAAYKQETKKDLEGRFYAYEAKAPLSASGFMAPLLMVYGLLAAVTPYLARMGAFSGRFAIVMEALLLISFFFLTLTIYGLGAVLEPFARRLYRVLVTGFYLLLVLVGYLVGYRLGIQAILLVLAVIPGILSYVFSYRFLAKEGKGWFHRLMLPMGLPLLVIAGLGVALYFAPIPAKERTVMIPICIGLGSLLLLAILFSCKGYARHLFPWPTMLLHLDCGITARSIAKEEKLLAAERKYFTPRKPFVQPRPPRRYTIDM